MAAIPEGFILRRAADRGRTRIGWLDSWHTFSFGHYQDPANMGVRSLRVINDDRVAPAGGFGEHGHRDMEILTWVLDGALEHRDSLGHTSVLRPGEAQVMTAGLGIRHSEYNASKSEPAHFLQIWLLPEASGLEPRYEQKAFPESERRDRWRLIASHDGRDGSTSIRQDADVYATVLSDGAALALDRDADRLTWLHVARGTVTLGDIELAAGDGVQITGPQVITLTARGEAELLRFDLA